VQSQKNSALNSSAGSYVDAVRVVAQPQDNTETTMQASANEFMPPGWMQYAVEQPQFTRAMIPITSDHLNCVVALAPAGICPLDAGCSMLSNNHSSPGQ
jgi:hypothetical protein